MGAQAIPRLSSLGLRILTLFSADVRLYRTRLWLADQSSCGPQQSFAESGTGFVGTAISLCQKPSHITFLTRCGQCG
jgi:hypothetical protein